MESSAAATSGSAGGGPAPFLIKTYDMIDDSSTDDIVSWSSSRTSFVVWNPPEFSARLLPLFFKHNNFSSFIRQLNTYGFRKIHPERWEFANEEFVQGQKHLLKNIHRRKPIHSHSHTPDQERAALEEEIDRLSREKTALQADLCRFRQQQPGMKSQLDGLDQRLHDMEQRQEKMISFIQRAIQNPTFMETLVKMAVAGSMDFSAIHKKRRLPNDNSYYDDHSTTSKNEVVGHVFHRYFSDKLKLELSPAISDCNLVSACTHSSNEDQESPVQHEKVMIEGLPLVPETIELSDTGTSFCSRKSVLFSSTVEDGDGLMPCHLNLTLASSSMQVDSNQFPSRTMSLEEHSAGNGSVLRMSNEERDEGFSREIRKNQDSLGDSGENQQSNNKAPAAPAAPPAPAATGRVNDVFWEQFLTERPGSSEVEEASSNARTNPSEEQLEERSPRNESMWKSTKDMEQLTL
ncbi:heat shock transcription factor protein [Dioscorea alata]|uniref:Heat shock transcription factor protein n=3 Tax=Dioscorea alata TaxID=55571 RepID=A0ACB7VAF2_DIOAL|nr:heat shock transcription factor protein [Dioscorea alata]KAH7670468.1 heat shock transcription factor protein [Dioscorea alata]KAH7670469.1 heat shock transcription factor protein [Dioscorea alata]